MRVARPVLSLLFVVVASVHTVHAVRYAGTIVGTSEGGMEDVWEHWYTIGETWTVEYCYNSDSTDGTFSLEDGSLVLTATSGFIHVGPGPSDWSWGELVIEDACVARFNFSNIVWYVSETMWDFDGLGGGSVRMTDPRPVPDSLYTFSLLALALLGMAARSRP
jgi:hypothetical protein